MNYLRLIILNFIGLYSVCHLYAQNSLADSLLIALEKSSGKDSSVVPILFNLAQIHRSIDITKSVTYYQQARDLSRALGLPRWEIKSLNGAGISLGMQNKYPEAMEYFLQGLRLAQKYKYPIYESDGFNNLGIIYKGLGDYPKSLYYYNRSIHIIDSMNLDKNLAGSFANVGILYDLMKEPEKAAEYYDRAYEIATKLGDHSRLASLGINRGVLSLGKKEYDQAISFFQQSLEYYTKAEIPTSATIATLNLGEAYFQKNRYAEAEKFLLETLEKAERFQLTVEQINASYILSKIYVKTGKPDKSLLLARRTALLADSIHSFSMQSKSRELLAYVYEQLGNTDQALRYYKAYKQFEDSLFNQEKAIAYKNGQVLMEVAEKDRLLASQSLRMDMLSKQATADKTWKILLAIVGLLSLAAGALYYQKLQQQRKSNEALAQKNLYISEQKELIQTINKELELQVALRIETDETINYFAGSLFGKSSVDEILWDVAKNCINRLGLLDCVIYLLDNKRNVLVQKAAYGVKNPDGFHIQVPIEIPMGQGIVGSVAQRAVAEIVNDTSLDHRYIVDEQDRLSELAVPLIDKGQVIGVIDSEHPEKNFFQRFHLDALKTIASICASKIAQVQANEASRKAGLAQVEAEQIKALDQLKSRFFANISHEFRTPLNLILAPLQLYRGHVPANELAMIRRNAQSLLRLVNQLLDLSKLEIGQLSVNLVATDLWSLFRTLFHSFSSLAESRKIRFQTFIPEGAYTVYIDPDKLEKICYNLISNAIKFTPEGGAVSASVQMLSKDRISFSISDTGIGIPEDLQDKIFDRFYQIDTSKTRRYEGAGIGLALCKELVDLLQGEIHVSSAVGSGSTFTVALPVQQAEADEQKELYLHESLEEIYLVPNPQNNVVQGDDGQGQILVVEDHPDLREYICRILEPEYLCIQAIDGVQGLNLARENIPDLIISDVMMPNMDGLEMSRQLKSEALTHHIPVLLLTARDDQETKTQGFQTGADQFLSKPFEVEELRVRVANLIQQRKLLREKYSKEINLKPQEILLGNPDAEFLERLKAIIEDRLSDPEFSVEQLQKDLGMSRMQLHRKLKALTGSSAGDFIRNFRLQRAAQLLTRKDIQVAEVAYQVGFTHLSYFAKCFKELFGVSPSAYIESTK